MQELREISKNIDLTGGNNDKNIQEMAVLQRSGANLANTILKKKNMVMIADDVGLGKTYEGLALLFNYIFEHEKSNSLIIAPNEYVAQKWENDCTAFKEKNCKNLPKVSINAQFENPLKIIKKNEEPNINHVISIIRLNKFSYINSKSFEFLKTEPKYEKDYQDILQKETELYDKKKNANSNQNFNQEEQDIKNKIANLLAKLNSYQDFDNFDMVIIDESQNLRSNNTNTNVIRFFNIFFGLNRIPITDYNLTNNNPTKKFNKTIFLTATPYHSSEDDVKNQIDFIKDSKVSNNDIYKTPITKELPANLDEYSLYIIKRNRTFNGHNKYYYREFEAIETQMEFNERLTMALIQKKEIDKKGTTFKMGYLNGFERFIPDNDTEEFDQKDNDKDDDTYLIQNFYNDLKNEENFNTNLDKILSHPKPKKIKELVNFDNSDKTLIFVRVKSSIKEIEKSLIVNFDKTIDNLVAKTLGLNSKNIFDELKKRLNKLNDKDNSNEKATGIDNDSDTEDKESKWLKAIKKPPLENKKNRRKDYILYYQKNKFYYSLNNFWEENYLRLLGFKLCLKEEKNEIIIYKKNVKKISITKNDIEEFIKKKNLIKEWNEYNYQKKSIMNYFFLNKLHTKKLINDFVYKEYEAFYFGDIDKEKTNNDIESINLKDNDLESIINLFENDSIWDKFDLNSLLKDKNKTYNINYKEENLLKREILKNIIKSNLLNSEAIIYFITLIAKINKKGIKYNEILDKIDENDLFWKRIKTRVTNFISDFGDIDTLFRNLNYYFDNKIDQGFYQNGKINTKAIQSFIKKYPCCDDAIVGCCSDNKSENITKKRIFFNTRFYPDVLIATDIFKEGIDLQRNCNHIIHYGIAWTPGDMEQRIGRIDRYFSKTYREVENNKKNAKVKITFLYMKNTIDENQIVNITSKMFKSVEMYNDAEIVYEKNDDKNNTIKDCEVAKNEYDTVDENIERLNNLGK